MTVKKRIPATLKLVLFYSSILHIVGGLMFLYDITLAKLYAEIIFGMNISFNSQLEYVIKILGLYSFLFGIIILMIAKQPYKYSKLIWILILLYLIRFIFSISSFNFMSENFEVSVNDMYLSSSILLISLVLLLIGKIQLNKD